MSRNTMPCIARTTDGSRCGRRIPMGTTPQLCHIHAAVLSGGHIGTPFVAADRNPEEVLEDLMRSKDDSARLRAVDIFLKRREREEQCPRCLLDAERDHDRNVALKRATEEQRARLRELVSEITSILDAARTQQGEQE